MLKKYCKLALDWKHLEANNVTQGNTVNAEKIERVPLRQLFTLTGFETSFFHEVVV